MVEQSDEGKADGEVGKSRCLTLRDVRFAYLQLRGLLSRGNQETLRALERAFIEMASNDCLSAVITRHTDNAAPIIIASTPVFRSTFGFEDSDDLRGRLYLKLFKGYDGSYSNSDLVEAVTRSGPAEMSFLACDPQGRERIFYALKHPSTTLNVFTRLFPREERERHYFTKIEIYGLGAVYREHSGEIKRKGLVVEPIRHPKTPYETMVNDCIKRREQEAVRLRNELRKKST